MKGGKTDEGDLFIPTEPARLFTRGACVGINHVSMFNKV